MMLLYTALAGGVGAACRFLVDGAVHKVNHTGFPLGTIVINVTGSLLMGLLVGAVYYCGTPDTVRQILGTGVLGGYTTFSTACVETVRLLGEGRRRAAVIHALGMLLLSMLGLALGLLIMHAVA